MDFVAAQIKTVSFLAYIIKIYQDMVRFTELTLFCFFLLALQAECSQCCGRLYSFDYEHNHPAAIPGSKVKQIPLPVCGGWGN